MSTDQLLEEIQDANLTYLMLARRLLEEDYASAQFRLKLDKDMADLLVSLSAKQLVRLARTSQFVFRLCFDGAGQVQRIVAHHQDSAMMQTHAALVLANA